MEESRHELEPVDMQQLAHLCADVRKDRDRQIAEVEQILKSLDTFIDAYHDDGGCDEGPGYWDRASASLFDCLYLLKTATQEKVTLAAEPKIKGNGRLCV